MPPAKKARIDFLAQVSRKYIGSGDPEISDAKDVVTYLSDKYQPNEFQNMLQGVHAQMEALMGKGLPHVPRSTVPDGDDDFWVMVWNLGHKEEHAYRGKPQTVHILEIAQSMLEKGFDSKNFPLRIALPHGAVQGESLGNTQFKHIVGFTRCLAAMLILEGVASLKLSDSELISMSDVLESCLCIKVSYTAYASEDEAREASLRLKFQVADSVRPTVFQIYFNLRKRVERAGQDFSAVAQDVIKAFNCATDIEGYRISGLEQKVVLMLPHQTETFLKTLEYHWQNYKTGESAVPLAWFEDEMGVFDAIVESDRKAVWAQAGHTNAMRKQNRHNKNEHETP